MSDFSQYTTDYISGVMSLRKPQTASLKILEQITNAVPISTNTDLPQALSAVRSLRPTCTDFEREFVSLTFALATGVGKTRLMGAFIAYLYTQRNIKNFFVVAPGTTVYEKLKTDLGDPSAKKYVFKGLGCFNSPPAIITDDDYRNRPLPQFESDIRIFIFNIDKFNKEDAKMRQVNEILGDSFYHALAALPDLVLIMDESHHYRAERGAKALDELRPVLGLELTATPLCKQGTRQVPFKNVVCEYPLSQAIADGYTRTPFAITRANVDFYNFSDEQRDKMMLLDGINEHENIRLKLAVFAANNGKPVVKPFMLVVCKDTDHATWVLNFIRSNEFKNGAYQNKTIVVHSKQKGSESEENMRFLLDVEHSDNPVEIVIHVNMLKEGWDVNNLYTIVPLRTAASKILREQMVGRGLRLPYGERTGDAEVDSVRLTAHDKFDEILKEALKGDSIFKAGNVIYVDDTTPEKAGVTQLALPILDSTLAEDLKQIDLTHTPENETLLRQTNTIVSKAVADELANSPNHRISNAGRAKIVEKVKAEIAATRDLGDIYRKNEEVFADWLVQHTEKTERAIINKYIPIPKIKVTDAGADEYAFTDFDVDLSAFTHVPLANDLIRQNLEDMSDRQIVQAEDLDFEARNPKREILSELRKKPEIDYERCSELLFKLITQVCDHYQRQFGENKMQNIVMMNKRDIADKLYKQMMQHFYYENGLIQEEVIGTDDFNLPQSYTSRTEKGLYDSFDSIIDGNIKGVLFTGIKKGVFGEAKFDSEPELIFARILEGDSEVKNWLRPAKRQFNITYNRNQPYEPDFVVETNSTIYLVEVKGEDKINAPDVIAKKKRAEQYCRVASEWGKANGYKEWCYLFIPSMQVRPSSSFMVLAQRFGNNSTEGRL